MSRFPGWDKSAIEKLKEDTEILSETALASFKRMKAVSKDVNSQYARKTHLKANTNELTKMVLKYLRMKNYVAWRQNNIPVFDAKKNIYRRNNVFKGVPDIIALSPEGKAYAFEIKTGNDRLSEHQKLFRDNWEKNKGVYIVIRDADDLVERI